METPIPHPIRGEIFAGGADARRSFHSESSSVIPAPGKPEGCFVYLGDRWFPDALEDSRYVWWPLVVRPDGTPLQGAEIAILGRSGATRTDEQGRFSWRPDPLSPFEVIVVAPGGRMMRPILVETLPPKGPLRLVVTVLEENVTVTAGSAPGIEGSPASATAVLPAREFRVRQPANILLG